MISNFSSKTSGSFPNKSATVLKLLVFTVKTKGVGAAAERREMLTLCNVGAAADRREMLTLCNVFMEERILTPMLICFTNIKYIASSSIAAHLKKHHTVHVGEDADIKLNVIGYTREVLPALW